MKIYKKIAEVQKEIGKLSKNQENPFFKSRYFDINSLLEQLQPLLEKHNLMVTQPINKGCVTSTLVDLETGDKIESSICLPDNTDPQKIGSAVTYFRRYTLTSLLALQAEDDDGNKASNNSNGSYKNDDKSWLNITTKGTTDITPQWKNLTQAIQDGKITNVAQVRDKYKVGKEVAEAIEKLLV